MADLPVITISTKTFPDFFTIPEKTVIGGITVDTAIEQQHTDRQEITRHPVQAGAPITDHSYDLPSECVLRCGWSNSSLNAAQAIVSGFFDGGSMSALTYVDGVYSQLLALKQSRQPFSVTTVRRKYNNMMITSLSVTTDKTTAQALMVEAVLTEIIIVNTSSTTLPPMANQKDPASTAEVQSAGTTSIQPATPAPGGSLPPTQWGQ